MSTPVDIGEQHIIVTHALIELFREELMAKTGAIIKEGRKSGSAFVAIPDDFPVALLSVKGRGLRQPGSKVEKLGSEKLGSFFLNTFKIQDLSPFCLGNKRFKSLAFLKVAIT
ncbi:hypothetical protein J7438_18185 [Thalassotalea sp. G20_0]|uniref:hypothetical protein n=1 Tax=Thalassotalea sp. G20_0 TaxID=2821093 RepID=UPI001ADCA9BB|nr:hypothetical protein [Thalassotalea sp. G20_0]MBO9495994.1 hypothetical protein [Thalassotalea sp. G20_0]